MTRHSSLIVKAPAKLNLCLKVTGRRADGYHDLVSIMIPVTLYDQLELEVLGEGIRLKCSGYEVPEDHRNLVYQAAQLFLQKIGVREGLHIRIIKNIPVAAGLGGGSSDAATTLLTLNEMWNMPLDKGELEVMALGLGADIPFFLQCHPSIARGIGEVLTPLENWPGFWYVIVTPQHHVSTAWVYRNLKLKLTGNEYDYIFSILKNENFQVSQILDNDLETVTSARYPVIQTIKKALVVAGAEGSLMSGSGSSVFGVFPNRQRAESAKEKIISQNLGDVFVVGEHF